MFIKKSLKSQKKVEDQEIISARILYDTAQKTLILLGSSVQQTVW